jgi:hypothetical protein
LRHRLLFGLSWAAEAISQKEFDRRDSSSDIGDGNLAAGSRRLCSIRRADDLHDHLVANLSRSRDLLDAAPSREQTADLLDPLPVGCVNSVPRLGAQRRT